MLDLDDNALAIVRRILADHLPGREVRIFGSRARGRAKPYSDLDLMIMGEPVDDHTRAALALDFEESDLPFRVDLLYWSDAPASLRQAIQCEGQKLAI
ncbi:nucleotidyltransferase family protein [Sulfuricystis multivorans]|uniref:nucleotidyltransferase family protein n=1 Tax=Sulfuricystis multivorans TaxID=2211108 RepID=UPI000F82554A|nr:nucleotidyltransferase domain-containing protein [Sulfuricystis multivorans]